MDLSNPGWLVAGITSSLVAWVFGSVQDSAARQGHARVMGYSAPFRLITTVSVILLLVLYAPMMEKPRPGRPDHPQFRLAVWLTLFVPMVPMFFLVCFYRITFDKREIIVRTPWFTRRRIPWDEVIVCEQRGSDKGTSYYVKTVHHGTFKFRMLMNGVESFLAEYSRQTGLPAPGRYR